MRPCSTCKFVLINPPVSRCSECNKSYMKLYYLNHVEKFKEYRKRPEKKIYMKSYRLKNKEKLRIQTGFYKRKRFASDLNYRLNCSIRWRINRAIYGSYKAGSAIKDLGCTIEQLKTHLETQFQIGMSWSNWSRTGWHIDHIVPLCYYDLTDPEQFKKAVYYKNLQPLWAKDNLLKRGNLGKEIK